MPRQSLTEVSPQEKNQWILKWVEFRYACGLAIGFALGSLPTTFTVWLGLRVVIAGSIALLMIRALRP